MELKYISFTNPEDKYLPPLASADGIPYKYYDISSSLNSLKINQLKLEIQNIALLTLKHLLPILTAAYTFKKTQKLPFFKATLLLVLPQLATNYLVELANSYQSILETKIKANSFWIRMFSSLYTPKLSPDCLPPGETKVLGTTFWHSPKLIVEDSVIKTRLDELMAKDFSDTFAKYKRLNTLADPRTEDYAHELKNQATITGYLKQSLAEDAEVFARLLRKRISPEMDLNSPLPSLPLEELSNLKSYEGLYQIKIEDDQVKILDNAPLFIFKQGDKITFFTFGILESLLKEAHNKNSNLDDLVESLYAYIQ